MDGRLILLVYSLDVSSLDMARIKHNALIEGVSGKIGKLVFKNYKSGVVITSAPDRSKVKLSTKQKAANKTFQLAVAYAKSILADPKKKKAYQLQIGEGKSVYHAALADFLKKNKKS